MAGIHDRASIPPDQQGLTQELAEIHGTAGIPPDQQDLTQGLAGIHDKAGIPPDQQGLTQVLAKFHYAAGVPPDQQGLTQGLAEINGKAGIPPDQQDEVVPMCFFIGDAGSEVAESPVQVDAEAPVSWADVADDVPKVGCAGMEDVQAASSAALGHLAEPAWLQDVGRRCVLRGACSGSRAAVQPRCGGCKNQRKVLHAGSNFCIHCGLP